MNANLMRSPSHRFRLYDGAATAGPSLIWTLDSGLWTLDSGLWTLDSHQPEPRFGHLRARAQRPAHVLVPRARQRTFHCKFPPRRTAVRQQNILFPNGPRHELFRERAVGQLTF